MTGILSPSDETFEIPQPDISHLVTEDDEPVDNLFSEKQMRLLTEPLFVNWDGPAEGAEPFVAMANVGLFYSVYEPAIVPDVLVSVGVELPEDVWEKRHRSYLIWEYGKPPDVVIEIVSNDKGGELDSKRDRYASIGIPYYVVFDPDRQIADDVLQIFARNRRGYARIEDHIFPDLNLGLILWEGVYENLSATWLRWCDGNGDLILTGAESTAQERQRAEQERQRAEQERQRAERLAEQLRKLGVEPEA